MRHLLFVHFQSKSQKYTLYQSLQSIPEIQNMTSICLKTRKIASLIQNSHEKNWDHRSDIDTWRPRETDSDWFESNLVTAIGPIKWRKRNVCILQAPIQKPELQKSISRARPREPAGRSIVARKLSFRSVEFRAIK